MNIIFHNETRKVNDLIPYEHNPRQMSEKQVADLKKSLEKFNLAEVPVINVDNMIIAGHQRIKILQLLGRGEEEIDIRVPNRLLTEDEYKEYNIGSNVIKGDWDWGILANNFGMGELLNWGFDQSELQKGFDLALTPEEKDDTVPEDVPQITKDGELWLLGKHRLLIGDSLIRENVERLMDGKHANMCFTDPPYNINYEGGMNETGQNYRQGIMNDSMGKKEFQDFLRAAVQNIIEFTDGGIYICMSSKEIETLKKVFEESLGHFQSFIIWVKNHFTLSRSDYQNMYEPMLYGWREGISNHYFINRRDIGNVWEDLKEIKTEFDGEYTTISFQGFKVKLKGQQEGEVIRKKQVTDIWRYDKPTRSDLHPTMKPIALVTEAITNSSMAEQIVLDTFLGSGSTLISAEKAGRICYGMEMDPKYASVILQRYAEFTGLDPVREDGVKWSELKAQTNA